MTMGRVPETKAHAAVLKSMRFDHSSLGSDETCDRSFCARCGNGTEEIESEGSVDVRWL